MKRPLALLLLALPPLPLAAAATTPSKPAVAARPATAAAAPATGAATSVEGDAATQEATVLAQSGKVKEAIARLERSRAALGGRGVSLLGALYLRDNRAADAVKALRPLADRPDAEAAVLYNAGRSLVLAGDVAAGQIYLARSVDKSPDSPARRELGMLLSRQGRVVEAYAMLRPWTLHHADDGDARLVAATLAIGLERPMEAIELLNGLADSPAVQLLAARISVLLRDGPDAVKRIEPVLANHPPAIDLEVRRVAAEAYLLASQPAKAVAVLQGKQGSVPALVLLLGRAQRQGGNATAAMATLAPLASRLPDDPKTVGDPRPAAAIAIEYGQLLLGAGKPGEAVTVLQKATRLHPQNEAAWDYFARALEASGRGAESAKARAQAQGLANARARALAVASSRPSPQPAAPPAGGEPVAQMPAYATAAIDLAQKGKPQQALDVVRQRLQAEPDDELARTLEVRMLLAQEQNAAALNAADAAVVRAPGNPDFVYLRGAVEMAMHDLVAAERDYRRVLQMAPKHLAAMSDLAVLLMSAGKNDEARRLLEQVLTINPQDRNAAANLEQLRKGT